MTSAWSSRTPPGCRRHDFGNRTSCRLAIRNGQGEGEVVYISSDEQAYNTEHHIMHSLVGVIGTISLAASQCGKVKAAEPLSLCRRHSLHRHFTAIRPIERHRSVTLGSSTSGNVFYPRLHQIRDLGQAVKRPNGCSGYQSGIRLITLLRLCAIDRSRRDIGELS